jgi:hypothetical protein
VNDTLLEKNAKGIGKLKEREREKEKEKERGR